MGTKGTTIPLHLVYGEILNATTLHMFIVVIYARIWIVQHRTILTVKTYLKMQTEGKE
jgi:hypothetical protein